MAVTPPPEVPWPVPFSCFMHRASYHTTINILKHPMRGFTNGDVGSPTLLGHIRSSPFSLCCSQLCNALSLSTPSFSTWQSFNKGDCHSAEPAPPVDCSLTSGNQFCFHSLLNVCCYHHLFQRPACSNSNHQTHAGFSFVLPFALFICLPNKHRLTAGSFLLCCCFRPLPSTEFVPTSTKCSLFPSSTNFTFQASILHGRGIDIYSLI